jgi:Fic family protein
MSIDRTRPHNLPRLPPKDAELETRAVLKKTVAARAALAELRATALLLPSQAVLLRTMGLSEAKMSSEIENIVTTNDALFRALVDDGKSADSATREVFAYQRALWRGFEVVKREGRPITTPLMEELVALIKGAAIGVRRTPGTRLMKPSGEVIYTPPEGEPLLRELLSNLTQFIHEAEDLDPLVRMAVMHYQFEAIHPFSDGNGRTGRILNILFLVEQDLLDLPLLYLSSYVMAHKARYYDGLRAVTEEGKWEAWILYLLDGVEVTAHQTLRRIRGILALMEETRAAVQAKLPAVYSKDLVELLFRAPYTKVSFVEEAGIAKRVTATSYLRELAAAGFLVEEKHGRELYFLNQPFWDLLARSDLRPEAPDAATG